MDVLLPAVRDALCDEEEEVRDAAARAFNRLQRMVGRVAVDSIVPALLEQLEIPGAEGARALHGLRQILVLRSKEVLPFLLPKVRREA